MVKLELSEDQKWYRVSLRLMGDHLPVDDIEHRLGIAPTYVGRKGEHMRGNPRYAKHHSNNWVWRYPSSSAVPFEDQIEGLLEVLSPKIAALKEILSIEDVEGELFLGFGSGNSQGERHSHPTC
jgi:hypothetical protein